MKRIAGLVVTLALVLSACGSANSVAASVNGSDITVSQVEGLIHTEESTIPKDQFAQFLGFLIQWEIVKQSTLDEWGISVTDDEVLAEADRIFEEAGTQETREEFTNSRGVTEAFLLEVAHQGLLDQAVRDEIRSGVAEPTPDEVTEATPRLTQVCVTHILVETEAEAQTAMERIEGGEDFGAVATEISQDPGSAANGGVLPCGAAGGYVEEFRDASLIAPLGEVYAEIVETTFGFHILLVTERSTADEVAQLLVDETVATELNEWFRAEIEAAEVTVDDRYGTWQTSPQPAVVAPAE